MRKFLLGMATMAGVGLVLGLLINVLTTNSKITILERNQNIIVQALIQTGIITVNNPAQSLPQKPREQLKQEITQEKDKR